MRQVTHIRQLFHSQRSLFVVVAATLVGITYPTFAPLLEPVIPALVAGLLFTVFYGFDFGDISSQDISIPVIVSLASLYLLVPLALYPVATVALSGDLLLGVLIVLAAPLTAGSSIIWTRLGGGNTVLATVIALASMLLAPIVMPAIITQFAGSSVDIAASELVVELAAMIVAGGVLAYFVPNGTVTERQLDDFSLVGIGVLIYVGVGASSLSTSGLELAFVAGIGIAALCLSAGLAYALYVHGTGIDDCITVLFSSSMKNLSVSVMVGAVFGGGAIIASITVFHVTQQLVSSTLVHRLAVTSTGPAQSSEQEFVAADQLGD